MTQKQPGDLTAKERARRWTAIARAATGEEPRNRAERRALERVERKAARRRPAGG